MIWHNDWVWHNLDEKIKNRNSNFKFGINPYNFKLMSFSEASKFTAKKIYEKHKNIYISLSGGMDSLYVTKVFHENDIPFKAIIITGDANTQETKYAFDFCSKNQIKNVVINKSGKELVEYYIKNIYSKIYSVGINATASVIACNYALENSGIAVYGDYLLDVENDTITCADWDFYKDIFGKNINYFYYTPEIAYAITKESKIPYSTNKFKLYGFEINRTKDNYDYSNTIKNILRRMHYSIPKERYEYFLMDRKDFLVEMEKYIN